MPLTNYKCLISNSSPLHRIPKTGVIGIVTRAKNHRLIQEIKPLLDALKTQANFWIYPWLYETILKQIGGFS